MKNTNKNATTTAATEKRLATMRANLDKLESEADAILKEGDAMTSADRMRLLSLVNVAYHSSGKIEGVYSVDSCAACDFCQKMIRAAESNSLIICGSCYAAADAWKEAAWRRHKLNARILSTVLFNSEELATLAIGALCRFNEDGDTVNATMGRNYLRIAFSHPATRFGYWFKNAPAVEGALRAEGITTREELPANVRFIHSSIMIGIEARPLWFDDAIFTAYPDAATTAAAIAAGAHECNGKRCRACCFNCYMMVRRHAEPLRIAELLRCSKARRADIMAALESWGGGID